MAADQRITDAGISGVVAGWFAQAYPGGPTPAQSLSWPVIRSGGNLLLVSRTGTGKTLAAFLAILDGYFAELESGAIRPGLRCVYVSPLRSLGYDIQANLTQPLEGIRQRLGRSVSPVRVAVRTGDTSARDRRRQRESPPHILITTPESLALLLSQPSWRDALRDVEQVILDEIHALLPTKRGADLAVSVERLAALCARPPARIGLSATCRPVESAARFLVGPGRTCTVVEAPDPAGHQDALIDVESLIGPGEGAHRGLSYRRLIRRLKAELPRNRSTVVFANTRALTEKLTHDLRLELDPELTVAAHHSALDADRRREVERQLRRGELRAVVTSTSLELGVDIGTAETTVMVGLPGSVSRCLQRVGRSGHRLGTRSRGVIMTATAGELAGAAVTAASARAGRIEPSRPIEAPLDVLCQQLVGMSCAGETVEAEALTLVRRTASFENLAAEDFRSCLEFLAGELAAPPGAFEPEPGASPRWTAPRIWRSGGRFGVRAGWVARSLRANVGTITTEASVRVVVEDRVLGTLEEAYAARLQPGDRFVLDGRSLEFRRWEGRTVEARAVSAEPQLPRWSSDRQSLSPELAMELARFREAAARRLAVEGPEALHRWLEVEYRLDLRSATVLIDLFAAQDALSEVPGAGCLLVEESPSAWGFSYAFHAPLGRSACEAMGRGTGARLGAHLGRNVLLRAADLGWSLTVPDGRLTHDAVDELLRPEGFADDVMRGLDRGELPARRFRHVAATGLMVLDRSPRGQTRVGGSQWVSRRLYPLVRAACPEHPLLKETRREVLCDVLDTPTALAWLNERPVVRFRSLEAASPFSAAWIDAGLEDPLRFETPADTLRRLHARLTTASGTHR